MTAAQSLTETINRISTHSDRILVPEVKRLQYEHSPGAFIFLGSDIDEGFGTSGMAGMGHRTQNGGREVQFQHGVTKNQTFQWMAGPWATYDTTPQDLVRRSKADWKHASVTRTISLSEQLYNRGEGQLVDLVSSETRDAVAAMMDGVMGPLYGGTDVFGSNAITGLDQVAGANDTVQTLGGATYAAWNSRGISARGTAAASVSFAGGVFATTGVANWRRAWNNASEGSVAPKVLLTTYAIYEAYESVIVPQERYAAPARTGDMSFVNLAFKTAPVFPDGYCTSGETIFANTDYVYLKTLDGASGSEFQPWLDALEQESVTSELPFKGQLCIDDRRFINKVTGQT